MDSKALLFLKQGFYFFREGDDSVGLDMIKTYGRIRIFLKYSVKSGGKNNGR